MMAVEMGARINAAIQQAVTRISQVAAAVAGPVPLAAYLGLAGISVLALPAPKAMVLALVAVLVIGLTRVAIVPRQAVHLHPETR